MTKSSSTGRALRAVSSLALLSLATIGSSCMTLSGEEIDDHWTFDSVPPRVARAFLGYDASRESSYRDFAWERKKSISLTLRRYLLNHNPVNPNQAPLESLYEQRPANSILPNPWNYIHVEGFLVGWALTGVPIPIPVDSIIGTLQPGGFEEFVDGIDDAVTKDDEDAEISRLPSALYGEDGQLPAFEMTKNAR